MQSLIEFVIGNSRGEVNLFAIIFLVSIWLYGVYILLNAKKTTHLNQSIVPEYTPPEGVSPILGRYIFTAGKMGGNVGELSQTGAQNVMFLSLYERGVLTKMVVGEDLLSYEIDPGYQNKQLFDDERLFITRLIENLGNSATIHIRRSRAGKFQEGRTKIDGYEEINKIWLDFWSKDLKKIAVDKGYVLEKFSKSMQIFMGTIQGAIALGPFFAFFPPLLVIPAICLWPFILVASIFTKLSTMLALPLITQLGQIEVKFILPLYFVSWITWFLVVVPKTSYLWFSYTEKGLEFLRKYNGYKYFLEMTDRDRLTLSFKGNELIQKEQTSFAWLAVFSLATDAHWDQWNKFVKNTPAEMSNSIQTSI